ncbi:MAG: NAD-dependent epimerase/dehydratase family protein [Pyrinomonadaceae bacterium]|nr:NAD-dependent epimerase/dehydratase family protein [Sphingobacteriaceae bacterium]
MILVTGATGFLGSELVKQITDQGFPVRAIKRQSSQIPPLLQDLPLVEWANADILDYFALEQAFESVTHVYHCAALLSFAREDKKKMLKINREGTHHIVNLCQQNNITKLVHVSSVAALGEARNGLAVTEKNPWEFNGSQSGYSISKYESEMEVWRAIAEGLNAVIVNPSIIIGKNTGKKGSGQIFATSKKGIKFYTSGSNGFIDVEDVAKAMIMLMQSNITAEGFLLNAENRDLKDILTQALKAFNYSAPSIEAKPWMMELGWRSAALLSLLNGKKYGLTKDTARSAFERISYSNEKFHQYFPDFAYKPINTSIKAICDALNT